MSTTLDAKIARTRMHAVSWGLWAERAVVRALEIDPNSHIRDGLLIGQPTSEVAFVIARAVGYLAGTQRAPDLPLELRGWIDGVGMCDGHTAGMRLGSLSWEEWGDRAAGAALELDGDARIASSPLRGEHLWQVAIAIARSVACLAGTRRIWALPAELIEWLQAPPRLGAVRPQAVSAKEEAR